MFDNDYTIVGKHATYVKFFVNDAKMYERYIDVYMNGAIFGLLYDRRAERDTTSTDRARIYADAFANCRAKCVFLYRLTMLLEKKTSLDTQERVDRAFRDDADENSKDKLAANLSLFHEYVLGGIEFMYENLIEDCHSESDYIERAMEFMDDFKADVSGVDLEGKIESFL